MFLEKETVSSLKSDDASQSAYEENLKCMKHNYVVGSFIAQLSLTFPIASNPRSKINITPRKRNAKPNPAKPTPISKMKSNPLVSFNFMNLILRQFTLCVRDFKHFSYLFSLLMTTQELRDNTYAKVYERSKNAPTEMSKVSQGLKRINKNSSQKIFSLKT